MECWKKKRSVRCERKNSNRGKATVTRANLTAVTPRQSNCSLKGLISLIDSKHDLTCAYNVCTVHILRYLTSQFCDDELGTEPN